MIEIISLFGYFLLGLVVGFISGAFGIGGGVVMVPSFLFFFSLHDFPSDLIPKYAIGTSLFASMLASSSGSYKHYRNKNVYPPIAAVSGIFAILSGYFLSFIALKLKPEIIKLIVSVVLIFVTIRLISDKDSNEDDVEEIKNFALLVSPILGILIGALSAFAGIGGGIIAVPILHYFLGLNFKRAIGTSSLMIVFSIASAMISYIINGFNVQSPVSFTLGYIYLIAGIPAGIGTLITARLGANFVIRNETKHLKILFGILIFIIDLMLLFDVFC